MKDLQFLNLIKRQQEEAALQRELTQALNENRLSADSEQPCKVVMNPQHEALF